MEQSKPLSRRGFLGASITAVVGASVGCSSSGEESRGMGPASGVGSGGTSPPSGGSTNASPASSGGSTAAGGASIVPASGGTQSGGGASFATGGGAGATAPTATGGTEPGSGGASASGGTTVATGGSRQLASGGSGGSGGSGRGEGSGGGNPAQSGASDQGGSTATIEGGSSGSAQGGSAAEGGSTATIEGGSSGSNANAGGGENAPASQLVALVRHPDVGQAVRRAIQQVGGLDDLTGATVLLKPNLNSGDPSPCSPSAGVLRAVIEMVLDAGAQRVIVGDRSHTNPNIPAARGTTEENFERSGLKAVVDQFALAETMDLGTRPLLHMQPAGASHWPDGFTTYDIVSQVDYIVNMCCCKHHLLANYTMAMKNWMGLLEQEDRDQYCHNDFGNCLPEIHLGIRENLIVLDATKALLTQGPWPGGAEAEPGIVIASKDPIAADVTGFCLIKHYHSLQNINDNLINSATLWNQPQIVGALATAGLGISSREQYTYWSEGIDEIEPMMQYVQQA